MYIAHTKMHTYLQACKNTYLCTYKHVGRMFASILNHTITIISIIVHRFMLEYMYVYVGSSICTYIHTNTYVHTYICIILVYIVRMKSELCQETLPNCTLHENTFLLLMFL